MTADIDDLPELVSSLVSIDSVNPSLVEGGAGERAIAEFVSAWATEAGLSVETVAGDPAPSRA